MRRQSFEIMLKSEVAVGSPGTVQGGRDKQDYLMGSLFLGAAAARLYRELGDDAWTVFHSGKVRFSDALPLSSSGLIAFPMPQSLATQKHQATQDPDRFIASELINLGFMERTAGMDKVGVPYLSAAGEKVRPKALYRLKTAIDPRSGVSMDRRLYGYQSLAPDQAYHFMLEADEDVPEALFAKLVDVFQKPMRLGRSRNAEYGRCEARTIATQLPTPVATTDNTLTLLLCAPLAVEDEGGVMPALPPSHQLGLPPGELVRERCFVRHGWQSMYNAAYRAYESDVPIIMRGSVLCYRMEQADLATVMATPMRFGGLMQQRGFGCMLVNPPFLAAEGAQFQVVKEHAQAKAIIRPDHPLANWLNRRISVRKSDEETRQLADTWYQELERLYESARVRGGFTADMMVGPTPSQWGRVAAAIDQKAGSDSTLEDLDKLLFDAASGICNAKDPDWSRVIVDEALEKVLKRPPNFKDWLEAKLHSPVTLADAKDGDLSLALRVRALAHFARFASDRAKQQRQQQEVRHG